MIETRRLSPDEVTTHLDAIAALRIEVFRAWPYLYDGDVAYERAYLQPYTESRSAVVVGAFAAEGLVGAATGTAMRDHADEFAAPLAAHGIRPDDVFYCAESVLRSAYRGRGIGHRFFEEREAAARDQGATLSVFCAVNRTMDHPLYEPGYRPLDPFWRARGYVPLEGAVARFSWRDIGEAEETEKPLQLWIKHL